MIDYEKTMNLQLAVFFDEKSNISILEVALTIKKLLFNMFPDEPQILQLPPDAPLDAPRVIFQMPDGDARLVLSLSRLDFTCILKDAQLWRHHVQIMEAVFFGTCKTHDIKVKRLGIVVQVPIGLDIIDTLDQKVAFPEFVQSKEKSIMWHAKEQLSEDILINVIMQIQTNGNAPSPSSLLMVDINTDIHSRLPEDEKMLGEITEGLTGKIQEKINNVF